MAELPSLPVPHSEPLHHVPRARVRGHGEGDYLGEPEVPEGEIEARSGGLGGVTAAPARARQAPSDLGAGREVGLEGGLRRPTKPMNWPCSRTSTAHSPQPRWASSLRTRSANSSLSA